MMIEKLTENSILSALDRFKKSTRSSAKYFRKEGILLNFEGYENMIKEALVERNYDFEELFDKIKTYLLWKDYLQQLYAEILVIERRYENTLLYLEAFVNPKRENKKLQDMVNKTFLLKKDCKQFRLTVYEQVRIMKKILRYSIDSYNRLITEYNQ